MPRNARFAEAALHALSFSAAAKRLPLWQNPQRSGVTAEPGRPYRLQPSAAHAVPRHEPHQLVMPLTGSCYGG